MDGGVLSCLNVIEIERRPALRPTAAAPVIAFIWLNYLLQISSKLVFLLREEKKNQAQPTFTSV